MLNLNSSSRKTRKTSNSILGVLVLKKSMAMLNVAVVVETTLVVVVAPPHA